MITSAFYLYCRSSNYQFHIMSHPLDKLAATNIRVLVERCSDNAEAMGSNPVEALNIFFGLKFKIA